MNRDTGATEPEKGEDTTAHATPGENLTGSDNDAQDQAGENLTHTEQPQDAAENASDTTGKVADGSDATDWKAKAEQWKERASLWEGRAESNKKTLDDVTADRDLWRDKCALRETDVNRLTVALKYGLSHKEATTVLHGDSVEQMEEQAKLLVGRGSKAAEAPGVGVSPAATAESATQWVQRLRGRTAR